MYRNISKKLIAINLKQIQYIDALGFDSNKCSKEEYYIRGPINKESLQNFEKKNILNYLIGDNNQNEKDFLFNKYDNDHIKVDVFEKSFHPSDYNNRIKNKRTELGTLNLIQNVTGEERNCIKSLDKSDSFSYRNLNNYKINSRYKSLKGDMNLIKIGVLFKDFVENGGGLTK